MSLGRSTFSLAPGRQWAPTGGKGKEPGRAPRRRRRATYTRTKGVRHLFAACDLGEDKLYGHIKPRKTRARFLEFCRYLRTLYPPATRIAIVCDNYSPHRPRPKTPGPGPGRRRATPRSPTRRLIRPG